MNQTYGEVIISERNEDKTICFIREWFACLVQLIERVSWVVPRFHGSRLGLQTGSLRSCIKGKLGHFGTRIVLDYWTLLSGYNSLITYFWYLTSSVNPSVYIRFSPESKLFYSDLVHSNQYSSLYFISYYLSLNICTNLGVRVTLAGTAPVSKLSVHSLFFVFGLQIAGAHTNSIVELSLYKDKWAIWEEKSIWGE